MRLQELVFVCPDVGSDEVAIGNACGAGRELKSIGEMYEAKGSAYIERTL